MNNNGLHKHYEKLNARERFVLITAAEMRDDVSEARRLAESAAKLNYTIADYTPFIDSWRLLEMAYLGDQMYECAAFWQAFYLQSRFPDTLDHHPGLLFALAYRVVVLFDGWMLFCEGNQITAPATIQSYGGWPFIVDTIDCRRFYSAWRITRSMHGAARMARLYQWPLG